ncbi:carotenoid oxygenase family protein [Nonomuraea typhae]|uniref:carotenoid oxygenase family protein n=1 Tax=Nonomuraea typhae TaxID=2603600 RepID=UPI0012FAF210|nr:carotenoid oxygenase family protein [Nonomuraea typhae]
MTMTHAPERFWEPVPGEVDISLVEITGTLPPELRGTLYRNGPGRWEVGSTQLDCLLDPDGMIGTFILDGSSVRFRNRYVRTEQYLQGNLAGRLVNLTSGQRLPGGIPKNVLRRLGNPANTNVLIQGERLFALWEGGRPYELDIDTLDTLGMTDLNGALKGPLGPYSAHYCWDPASESVVNFGVDPYMPRMDLAYLQGARDGVEWRRRVRELLGEVRPRIRLRLYETDRYGVTRYLGSVPMATFSWIHDMALTPRYAIFAETPVCFDFAAVTLGSASGMDAMRLKRNTPARFILVPRDGGPVRTVETDPFFLFHFTNAYDEGNDVIVELPRFAPDTFPAVKAWMRNVRTGTVPSKSVLTRYRISASGKVTLEDAGDVPCEFPQFDQRFATQRHHVTFAAALGSSGVGLGAGVARFDHRDSTTDSFRPEGHDLAEPVFVPRAPDSPEGDGWVLTIGYHQKEHRSSLMIFDAEHLADGPVAEAWLPFHIPGSFHGAFTTRIAT